MYMALEQRDRNPPHLWTSLFRSSSHGCRPLLARLLSYQDYTSVKQEDLRQFLLARLRIFYEEELDVPLVL